MVAVQVATGDLYRYNVSAVGLHSGMKIGHGWNSMRFVLAPGQFSGSAHNDLVAIHEDGRMFAYEGAANGYLYGVGQIGHGWGGFTYASIPGDLNGDGKYDLIGIRNEGTMFSYLNKASGSWTPATQIGHGWQKMLTIS